MATTTTRTANKLHRFVCPKKVRLCLLVYFTLLIINKLANCRKLDSTRPNQPQLNSSGWRTISFDPETIAVNKNFRSQEQKGELKDDKLAGKKLIEWDDDELNDLHHLKDVSSMITFQNLHGVMMPKNDYYKKGGAQTEQQLASHKTGNSRFSKLVYHGQVKRSGNMKVIDGIKLYINTHRPVSINRHKFAPQNQQHRKSLTPVEPSSKGNETIPASTTTSSATSVTKSTISSDQTLEEPSALSSRWTESRSTKAAAKLDTSDNRFQLLQESKSSWKPILYVSTRSRRTTGKQGAIGRASYETNNKTESPKLAETSSDLKWKPITSLPGEQQQTFAIKLKKANRTTAKTTASASTTANVGSDESVVYGKKVLDLLPIRQVASSRIEQPFEDDGIIVATRKDQFGESSITKQREPKAVGDLADKSWDNRWTPVETTTAATTTTTTLSSGSLSTIDQLIPMATTTAAPSQGLLAQATNHSELAQKSASDLNYIYSSQPVANNQRQEQPQDQYNRQPVNSYYSNYVMQPTQQVVEQPVLTGTIIDTSSGQTPEMILDREPQPVVAQQVQTSDYSMPQTSASFQPAQAPPSRPANVATYADGYYNTPARSQAPYAAAPQPLPVRQLQTTVAPTREIVRQEHHYHYYNSNQQNERSLGNNNNNDNNRQQPVREQPSQIIREIQPVLISQPIIQQQASTTTTTTPAPTQQIIREIIKEVPMQTREIMPIQMPRIIIPQAIPQISMSSQPSRDFDQVYPAYQQASGSSVPSAQRIMRQISSSIPTVSMRALPSIPGIPQIRIPIPSLQLPNLKLGAQTSQGQVTRQTGAFVIPPMPKKTTTYLTETQEMPSHTTIMHTTQFTPATRTIVYTTDHQTPQILQK